MVKPNTHDPSCVVLGGSCNCDRTNCVVPDECRHLRRGHAGGWQCKICKAGSLVRSNFKFSKVKNPYCKKCWENIYSS